jgi:opine dehydrogenase
MAADLILRGFKVTALYDRFEEALAPVRERGGIELVGDVMQGFAPVELVTNHLEEAVAGADVLMVVVPSFAHKWVAEQVAPFIRRDHVILLHPGYLGGSILFKRILFEHGAPASAVVGDAHILIYATRIVGRGVVGVRGVKKWVQVAAFPSKDTPRLMAVVGDAFPQFVPAQHVLETGVNNPNPMIHIPVYMLNYARIEQREAPVAFDFHDWMTAGVERVHAALDRERVAIARGLHLEGASYAELNQRSYAGSRRKIVGTLGEVPASAESLPSRFVMEDVPMGLVPLASLGRATQIPTPTIDALITLASHASGEDFSRTGRTLETLGLSGLTLEALIDFVQSGGQPASVYGR